MTSSSAVPETTSVKTEENSVTFADLGLPKDLLSAVKQLGFTTPSPIQQQAIPILLSGQDLIGVAQTGTGKTAAFGLPLLSRINVDDNATQALVLCPTRELAMQVADAIESFAAHQRGMRVTAVYGGAPYMPQERALNRGSQVVVGTPGRVIDHLKRGNLKLDNLTYMVLDEADEMLRMGFAEDVDQILSFAPGSKQVALFSATMPPAIKRVAEEHMNDPQSISIARQSTTVTTVKQSYAVVPFRHKIGALSRVLATSDTDAAIVFVRTRSAAEEVGAALIEKGINAATISGDVAQKDRERIVSRLRDGSLDVLVATDVAARGLDVDRIGLVVNFDVPSEGEAYVHRIGRTGRAGRTGVALTFLTPHERGKLRLIERTTRQKLEETQIPSPVDVSRHKAEKMLAGVQARLEAGRLGLYTDLLEKFMESNEVSLEQVAAVLLAQGVGDEGPNQQREDDEDFQGASLRGGNERDDRRGGNDRRGVTDPERRRKVRPSSKGYTAYKISVGHSHNVKPQQIVGTITGEAGLTGKDVGKIDIFGTFSLVEILGELSHHAVDKIGRARINGRMLRIGKDTGPKQAPRPKKDFQRRNRKG